MYASIYIYIYMSLSSQRCVYIEISLYTSIMLATLRHTLVCVCVSFSVYTLLSTYTQLHGLENRVGSPTKTRIPAYTHAFSKLFPTRVSTHLKNIFIYVCIAYVRCMPRLIDSCGLCTRNTRNHARTYARIFFFVERSFCTRSLCSAYIAFVSRIQRHAVNVGRLSLSRSLCKTYYGFL